MGQTTHLASIWCSKHNMKGFGLTPLFQDRRGYMHPQLKKQNKKLLFWISLLPSKKCVTRSIAYVNKVCHFLNPYLLRVLMTLPFNKLPWSKGFLRVSLSVFFCNKTFRPVFLILPFKHWKSLKNHLIPENIKIGSI